MYNTAHFCSDPLLRIQAHNETDRSKILINVSLMLYFSLQAGLIVKLLMKLSGQMTPNDKGIMDKYAYG